MSIQGSKNMNRATKPLWKTIFAGIILCVFQFAVQANEAQIQNLDFTRLSGGRLQLQLELDGPAPAPRVFHTDNPARIALDFSGVKSGLSKKKFPINLDAADSVYVAESGGRLRVVINLTSSVPYETRTEGNKVFVTLAGTAQVDAPVARPETSIVATAAQQARSDVMAQFLPEQGIKGLDFRRGPRGEGRILISLTEANTMVNTREVGGKVEIYFVNTRLPERLSKRYNVSEFATPVKSFDAVSSRQETKITVDLQSPLYEYSQFQSEGLLTVEFRPLTQAEKDLIDSQRDRYTGDRLSLNFQDIEIRSVITLLSEFTGQNVVAGDEVTGRITLKLDDVPWDEALDFMMMTKGLEKYQTGNVTLIAPVGKIKEYKEKQRETEKVVEQLEPLRTEYIKINFARAESFRNLLYGLDSGEFGQCGIGTIPGGTRGGAGGRAGGMGVAGGMAGGGMGAAGIGGGQGMMGGIQQRRQSGGEDDLSMMSPRGTAVVDSRTNTLIVRETSSRLEEIRKLIARLDVPVRQVMIESRIVIASNVFARDLGVRFGAAKGAMGNKFAFGGGQVGTPVGAPGAAGGAGPSTFGNFGSGVTASDVSDLLVDLSATNPYGALAMTLARGADYVLNLEISALQDEGRAELLSNPRVMTSDRCQAKIRQGFEVPFQSSSGNLGINIEFKQAELELDVTPQITPSGTIQMALLITKNEPDFARAIAGNPPIVTRELETNVQVMDGETVVLGGIFEGVQNDLTNKIPFFADIPGIGFLFRRNEQSDEKSELLIFVTPKIVHENLSGAN
ncbi:MAG: type IV pilus secretin PilQ [Gammaproteobacteria bacterium HGW-Gammaproteobacteria-10]|nr:MAG: type IV pilus secretin PilQ [Gammaproteobacteria bacterium HGW-Gammaproteobacteria-10]